MGNGILGKSAAVAALVAVSATAGADWEKNAGYYRCARVIFPSEMDVSAEENPAPVDADIRICAALSEDPGPVRRVAAEIFGGKCPLSEKISSPSNLEKSEKFAKLAKLDAASFENAPVYRMGDVQILVFDPPENSKLKRGMNYAAFRSVRGKTLWDVSFKDPAVLLLLEADKSDPSDFDPSLVDCERDTEARRLLEKRLPFLTFKGIPLTTLARDPGIDSHPAARRHREAQKIFLDLKLDEYSLQYAPVSRAQFRAKFLGMSRTEQREVLADYMLWEKRYLKFADGGDMKILFFERCRNGEKPRPGATFFEYRGETPFIWGFEPKGGAFEMFLSKYLLSGSGSEKPLSEKFLRE